jgi:hypothetical protein
MAIYLLFLVSPILLALFNRRIGDIGVFIMWAATTIFLIGLMPVGSRDFENYVRDFDAINGQQLFEVIKFDPLYSSMVWTAGHIGIPPSVFYISLASIALAVKLVALAKLTDRQSLTIVLYMCSFFFLHEFTQIRASLAIGLWMLGLSELAQSRSRYFMWTLLASFFHIQAALGLLVYPIVALLNSHCRVRVFAVVMMSAIIISVFGIMDSYALSLINSVPDPRVAIYTALAMESTQRPNPLNVISILAILTALVGLLPKDRRLIVLPLHQRIETYVFTSLLVGSLSLASLTFIPVAAFRISEHYFSLLPVGIILAAQHVGARKWIRPVIWAIAGLFLYVFLIHSPYLLDPMTGQHARDNV